MAVRKRLGERLIEEGLITPQHVEEALATQKITGENIGETLVSLGYLREDDLVRALCEDAGIPYYSIEALQPENAFAGVLAEPIARAHVAVPVREENGRLLVAMADPFDIDAVTAIERALGRAIRVVAGSRRELSRLLDQSYGGAAATATLAVEPERGRISTDGLVVEAMEEGGTAAQIVDEIIRRGVALAATDIHIEPLTETTRVRYRLDGILQDGSNYARIVQPALMTRLKILAGLNIAESRLPQDGRFRFNDGSKDVDLRISTFPTLHGEDVVLRILDRARVPLDFTRLGIHKDDVTLLRGAMKRPHGLIAVTGPTGSGKTTTLYAGLAEMNSGDRCIITLEDPIEYEMPGLRQSQINVKAGLTFASGLRSILRHDPDVILVGEMRDQETVQIGLSAALTGHLVLTTLHTNTAAGAIPRLLDMGAEPFLLASALLLVVSQRLVRKLCEECRERMPVPEGVDNRFKISEGARIYRAVGCAACRGSGYRGRVGIFEMLPVGPELESAIYERKSAEEIQRIAARRTLHDDGVRKVIAGETTLDELLRVTAV